MDSSAEDVLADSNVLLRSIELDHPMRPAARAAIARTYDAGNRIVVARQSLAELWAVATRSQSDNGLNLSPADARRLIDDMRQRFILLPEPEGTFEIWLDLVSRYGVRGKTTHDARLVATMLANGVTRVLTFNGVHFARFAEITVETL